MHIVVSVATGGGGGGGGWSGDSNADKAGGSGGGGGGGRSLRAIRSSHKRTPNTTLAITIGAKGLGGAGANTKVSNVQETQAEYL